MSDIDTLLQRWAEAERSGDPTVLGPLLTDDFLGVGPLGFVLPKQAWLARRDQGLTYDSFELDEVRARHHGDAAVVTLLQRARGNHQGQPIPEAARATLALVHDHGGWQIAGIHLSFVAGTPGSPPLPTTPSKEAGR
jgi:ketosteroid isomerase-like protein